ncbi:MAG: amidophosphoribosyltransferase [Candidatus Omnitrophica bacterium]|nr:amidophosphoribosyltransferase [Candidatus Omnitrophota bacterium]
MSGIFGVVSKGNCIQDLFYGTDYHSHLGTEYGGLVVLGEDFYRRIHNISQGQFKSKFFDEYQKMKGNKGIGVISASNVQPIYVHSRFGPFCIVSNGFIENSQEIEKDLLQKGISFAEVGKSGVNETELVAKLINQGDNLIDGIEKMFERIKGSCSLLLLNKDGVYAARDRYGYTPLVLGERKDTLAVTTETCAFLNNDFKITKYLGPGEIVLLSESGLVPKRQATEANQICAFLWVYTGFPASSYEGINTEVVRERCGRYLARRDKEIKVDVVSGVPDSGTAHAIGYAMESGSPYRRPLVKYTPGYGRSYTPPSQEKRDLVAKMKLIAIKDIIDGNRIVVCDDSIVRGTQLKNFTIKKLKESGAREIHVRPACPPLMFPCRFNLSTRDINELVARRAIRSIEGHDLRDVSEYTDSASQKYKKMIDWIAEDLEVDTLKYQTVDDMVAAIGLPKEKLCLFCWTGKYPGSDCAKEKASCACAEK